MMKKKITFPKPAEEIDIRILMIRVETSNREGNWTVFKTDQKGTPEFNYIECDSVTDASKMLKYILENYEDVALGIDSGIESNRSIVGFKCS